jgi:hypothetical protein
MCWLLATKTAPSYQGAINCMLLLTLSASVIRLNVAVRTWAGDGFRTTVRGLSFGGTTVRGLSFGGPAGATLDLQLPFEAS